MIRLVIFQLIKKSDMNYDCRLLGLNYAFATCCSGCSHYHHLGFNFVVIKVGLDDVSPLSLCFARFFLASLPLVLFIKRPRIPLNWLITYSLVMFALQFSLLFLGMKLGTSPGLASLLLQSHVFFTILFAVLFLGEKPGKWQLLGAAIAFCGIGLIGVEAEIRE